MHRLTTSGALRRVLTQHENSLNFYQMVRSGKILLADLSKGYLGESTSHLLGSIIVSQIQLAATRQAQLPAQERTPFSLFVDEVQNFTTSAFSTILSEARKYKLRLCIAHQFVSQLPPEILKAVFGNVGTMVFFAMSPDDLGAARHELGSYEAADIANLPKYHALCRPATAARDTFPLVTLPPPAAIPPEAAEHKRAAIINFTREEYGEPQQPQPVETSVDSATAVTPHPPEVLPVQAVEEASGGVAVPVSDELNVSGQSETAACGDVAPAPVMPVLEEDEEVLQLPPIPILMPDKPKRNDERRQQSRQEQKKKTAISDRASDAHNYLKSLVKRIAEREGFLATEEKAVFGGAGKVDVALENGNIRIGCEIAVTNTVDYELRNIRKCLAAGFDCVAVIAPDERHLAAIRNTAESNLSETELGRVRFLPPEDFYDFLKHYSEAGASVPAAPGAVTGKVKGFQVTTDFVPIPPAGATAAETGEAINEAEQKARENIISNLIENVLERKKEKSQHKNSE